MPAAALPPSLPARSVRRTAYDGCYPNFAWRSSLAWCLDTWPGVFGALFTAAMGERLIAVLVTIGPPGGLVALQVVLWLWMCVWVLRRTPKYSSLFARYFDNPAPYFLLRRELMGVDVVPSDAEPGPRSVIVRVSWNRHLFAMPLAKAEGDPWKILEKFPQVAGTKDDAKAVRILARLLEKTLEEWREHSNSNRSLSRHIDYAVCLKASYRRP